MCSNVCFGVSCVMVVGAWWRSHESGAEELSGKMATAAVAGPWTSTSLAGEHDSAGGSNFTAASAQWNSDLCWRHLGQTLGCLLDGRATAWISLGLEPSQHDVPRSEAVNWIRANLMEREPISNQRPGFPPIALSQ